MSEDATLEEFVDAEGDDTTESATDTDTLDQEQFGPFTLSTPGEWSAKRLGDIKRLITRGKQPTYDDDGIPVINQECIYWDGWRFENLRYLDEDVGMDWKDKYFPQRGDVILNSTGQGTLGRAQVYPDNKRRAIDSHVTLLRTDDELNPYFHRYFLESHLGQALLYSMCVNGSTGQIELSKTRLDLQPIPLPPLPEQRKISTVLYTVDRAIEKTEEIIEQTEKIGRGLRQSLFTEGYYEHETESYGTLGEVPTSWEKTRLYKIADVARGKFTHRPRNDPDFYGGEYPFIQTGEVVEAVGELTDFSQTLNEKGRGVSKEFAPGTIIITIAGNIGDTAVATFPVYFPDSLVGITPDEETDERFLEHFLRYRQAFLNRLSTKTTQKNLNLTLLRPIEVVKPPLDEQKEIADTLSAIDNQIKKEKEYKNHLQRLKRGLMQDLLSGTVRTTDTNIEFPEEIGQYG